MDAHVDIVFGSATGTAGGHAEGAAGRYTISGRRPCPGGGRGQQVRVVTCRDWSGRWRGRPPFLLRRRVIVVCVTVRGWPTVRGAGVCGVCCRHVYSVVRGSNSRPLMCVCGSLPADRAGAFECCMPKRRRREHLTLKGTCTSGSSRCSVRANWRRFGSFSTSYRAVS